MSVLTFALAISAAVFNGVLAGAGLIRWSSNFRARRKIGTVAYSISTSWLRTWPTEGSGTARCILAFALTVGSGHIAGYLQNVESSADDPVVHSAAAIALISCVRNRQEGT